MDKTKRRQSIMEHIQKDDIIIQKRNYTYFGQPHRISWLIQSAFRDGTRFNEIKHQK